MTRSIDCRIDIAKSYLDEAHNDLTFIRTVRYDTFGQGPANLTGPSKYVPFGITRFTLPEELHAFFHAALKAWIHNYRLCHTFNFKLKSTNAQYEYSL